MSTPLSKWLEQLIIDTSHTGQACHYFPAAAGDQVESLLHLTAPYLLHGIHHIEQDIKLLNGGKVSRIDPTTCSAGSLSHYATALLLTRGTTIVFQHLEKRAPFFYHLFQTFLRDNAILSHFNVYWSPAGSSGAGAHKDVHDVIVIQLAGRKRWKMETQDIDMQPGDLLFIRSDTLHDPLTPDASDSIHMTIGLVPKGKQCQDFAEPSTHHTLHDKAEYLCLLNNMAVLSREKPIVLRVGQHVTLQESHGVVIFKHRESTFPLKLSVYKWLFKTNGLVDRLSFREYVDRQHIINLILAFYKSSIPFSIEESRLYA